MASRLHKPRHTHRGLGGRFAKAPVLDPKWVEYVRNELLMSLGVPRDFYDSMIAMPHTVIERMEKPWRVSLVSRHRALAGKVSLPDAETTLIVSH